LSYAWGNLHETLPIYVDEDQFLVTVNLHAALSSLRDHSFQRIIWVDAICIDQTNPEEQGQQVQLMAKIYSNASCVIVWLREKAEDTEGALEDIRLAANRELMGHSKKGLNHQSILNLLQRPWFQRIWVREQTLNHSCWTTLTKSIQVLQEVAAARHVVIMCGSTEIDGYAFCLGLKSLQKAQKLSYIAFPELQSLPSLTNLIERASL
jgi:hypothetical protein